MTLGNGITTINDGTFLGCSSLTSMSIPNGVTSIGDRAYQDCNCLTSVTIPNTIQSIGELAFSNCGSLVSVTIPNNVTSIGSGAFQYCASLISLTIPNSVTLIGERAFQYCSSLTSLTIPEGVTSIGSWFFTNCFDLMSVTIPNSVTSIDEGVFYGCRGLSSLIIPNNVTTIGVAAFMYCDKLETLMLPNKLQIIRRAAFNGCNSLKSVTIPATVEFIYQEAFANCQGLENVKTLPKTPPFLYDNSFSNFSIPLKVPYGCKGAYQTAQGWNNFTNISEEVKPVDGINLDKSEAILEKGKTMTLKATVSSEIDDKSVTWKSSNTAVATVSSKGKVKGVRAGTATITCTSNATGESAICQLIVGYVKLDKTEAMLEKGKTMTLTPTVYPSKLEDRSVTWKSSDTKVATVTNEGEVKGVKAGFVTITCTSNATGLCTTCELTVGYVKLDKTEATLKKGETMTLTPTVYPSKLTDRSVIWKSSDETIAKVTSSGEVTGVNAGTAVITCTSNATGLSTTCTVTVVGSVKLDKTEAILKKGKTMTLKATVSPEIDDKSVTWKSSDKTIATVTSAGKVKGVKSGVVTITCTSVATGAKATCKVTVGTITLNKSSVTIKKGKTVTLKPTVYPTTLEDKSVTWKSSDKSIATVTSAGKVKGVKSGTATITCTSNATGLSTTCKVTVGTVILNLSEIAVNKGMTTTLEAFVYPETVEDQNVSWESSDETVATVSSDGKVKGIAAGTATITCTSVATGLSTTCKVTVTEFTPARTLLGGDEEVTDIEMVEEMPAAEEPFDVYDLKGHRVLHQVTSLDGLPAGVYIVNGKKVLKK